MRRIPRTVRHLLELAMAFGLMGAAALLWATTHLGWAIAIGILALPLARLFGILVIDKFDLWLRGIKQHNSPGDAG